MNGKIIVLLSTYNGDKFLCEQLDSIMNQTYQNIEILIRDDGSSDNTVHILEKYSKLYDNVKYYVGHNMGIILSFFNLINTVMNSESLDGEFDYIALADQDDVWLPRKLEAAVYKISEVKQKDKPILYCSSTQLVDEHLKYIRSGIQYKNVKVSFENALVENMCTGCTAVLNRELCTLLRDHTPRFTVMHDFWLYLVSSCFGQVIYDTKSYILYRQHDNNVIGSTSSKFQNIKRRIQNFKKYRGQLTKQAGELLKTYNLPEEKEIITQDFLNTRTSWLSRRRFICSNNVYRQRVSDHIILKVLIAFGLV